MPLDIYVQANTDLEVYAIRRMATSLEEHLLNQALKNRNLTPPKGNLPLTIPVLAHPSFQSDLQRWLAQLLNHHKQFAIPLHLHFSHAAYVKQLTPPCAVACAATGDGKPYWAALLTSITFLVGVIIYEAFFNPLSTTLRVTI